MKKKDIIHCLLLGLFAIPGLSWSKDPIREQLPPPEFLLQKAEEIGLTGDQRHSIEEIARSTHELVRQRMEKVNQAKEALVDLLREVPIDQPAAAEKFAWLIEAENEAKNLQFTAMIEIRNLLTEAQLEQAREVIANMPPPDPALREIMENQLKPRMEKLQAILTKNAENGEPPYEAIRDRMEQLHELLKDGKAEQALEMLDDMLSEVGG